MIKYEAPGTFVADHTLPEAKNGHGILYRVPADPNDLEATIRAAIDGGYAPQRSSRLGYLVVGNLLVITLGCLVYWWHARKVSQQVKK